LLRRDKRGTQNYFCGIIPATLWLANFHPSLRDFTAYSKSFQPLPEFRARLRRVRRVENGRDDTDAFRTSRENNINRPPQIHAANREPRDGCMRRGPVAAASVLAFFGSTAGKMILARVQELNIKPTSEKAAMAATTKGLLPEKRLC